MARRDIYVVSEDGCPEGVYAEANVIDGRTVVDWTNGSLGSLGPDDLGIVELDPEYDSCDARGE